MCAHAAPVELMPTRRYETTNNRIRRIENNFLPRFVYTERPGTRRTTTVGRGPSFQTICTVVRRGPPRPVRARVRNAENKIDPVRGQNVSG